MTKTSRAGFVAIVLLAGLRAGVLAQSGNDLFQQALVKERTDGDIASAISIYQSIVEKHATDHALVARALVQIGQCYEKLGQSDARVTYERVVHQFANQAESAATARTRLAAMASAGVAQVGQAVRLLWNDLGRSEGSPNMVSPSAAGRYVSFSEGEGNQAQGLGILDLRAGRILHVARTNLSENAASWGSVDGSAISPDGRQVAYIWEMEAGEELRVLQVDGDKAAKSRSVHLNRRNSMSVGGWSPDGKSVVVVIQVGDGATAQIAVVSMADGAVRVLRENFPWGGKSWPRFSPDGRYVAYERRDGQNPAPNDIFVLTLDGRETRVVEDPGFDSHPMWSPDGSHIVFLSNRTGTVSLWMIPVAGGTPTGPATLVKADVGPLNGSEYGPFFPLGMTRSGALYYVAANTITNVYTAELDRTLNAPAGPSIATKRYLNSNLNGVWSPDGQYLAYLSTDPRGLFIRIQTVKTSEDREVPARIPISGPVRWFPDGQSLLVASRDARILRGQVAYYRVNIASGNAELLHQSVSRDLVSIRPDLSPDGKTIFYLETPGQPVRFDIDSRRETRLTPVGSVSERDNQPWSLAVSPDGAHIAYLSPGRVVVVPTVGGEPRELVRLAGSSDPYERVDGLGGLAWSPDRRYLFFVKPDIRAIWRVPVAGGEAENIVSSKNRIRALRMHPDGRRLIFDLVDAPSELWVLENFLPKTGAAR